MQVSPRMASQQEIRMGSNSNLLLKVFLEFPTQSHKFTKALPNARV